MRKALFILIFIVSFLPIFKALYVNRIYYLSEFDLEKAEGLYNISQYIKDEGALWIADETLFAYAGWKYIRGGNPILLNPENPPLGKYLVGASIYLFNSEKLPTLLFSFISLLSFYLLGRLVLENKYLALFPVALFSWGRLFQEQLLFLPLFELFALAFLAFCFYFFIRGLEKSYFFVISHLFLGALWATRPWMATIPLLLSFLFFLLFFEKKIKKTFYWLIFLPFSLVVLLANYHRLFLEGYNLIEVLKVQKWILWYHQSRLIRLGSVWPLIYQNRWFVWWGEEPYLPMVQWNIFWPIFTTLALVFSALVFLKTFGLSEKLAGHFKFDKKITVICLWVVFYLMFLSVGNISSRYLFYLLPFNYLLGVYFLRQIWVLFVAQKLFRL